MAKDTGMVEYIKQIDLFKNLDERALQKLAEGARVHELYSGDILFNEGIEGKYFFIVADGSIRLYKTSYEGKESTIKIIYRGEFFAEAILYGKTQYPVSAVSIEQSKVIAVHRDSFWDMVENAESRKFFIGAVFEKLRYLTDKLHYISSLDVEERFFRFLIDNYGKHYKYRISIPKKEIASAIGTIPETFSRLLLRLTRMGIIAWKQDTLIIKEGFWDNDIFGE